MDKPFDAFLSTMPNCLKPDGHVLVVDDEPYDRYAARRILEQKGFRVTEASSGPQALQFIEQERPDLVLLDLNMPGMDGARVLKKIREQWVDLPVVVLSGDSGGPLVAKVMEYAPTLVLSKVIHGVPGGKAVWHGMVEEARVVRDQEH